MAYTLQQLADCVGGSVQGCGDTLIEQVAAAETAGAGQISFVNERRYLAQVKASAASAVIATEAVAAELPQPVLVHPNPYLAYAKVAQLLNPRDAGYTGIHPSAWVDASAQLGEDVVIGPQCSVAAGVQIGKGSVLQAGVVLEEGVQLGQDCWLAANVSVARSCILGDAVTVQAGAVIGSDGFGFARDAQCWQRIPQLGRVVIGNRVEIGANTCIDRGALNDTVIADGVILDNLIQIAHNVNVGENTAMAAMTGVAGSTRIGANCTLAGSVKVIGHLQIADGCHIAADTLISNDIKHPGSACAGSLPMDDIKHWRKNAVRFKQLDEMARRIKQLERQQQDKNKS